MQRIVTGRRLMASLRVTGLLLVTALVTAGCRDRSDSVEIEAPGVSVKASPDGAEIRAPGVHIKASPGGTQVAAPGVDVKAGPQGAEVSAPGVNVQAGRDGVTADVARPVSDGADSQPQN